MPSAYCYAILSHHLCPACGVAVVPAQRLCSGSPCAHISTSCDTAAAQAAACMMLPAAHWVTSPCHSCWCWPTTQHTMRSCQTGCGRGCAACRTCPAQQMQRAARASSHPPAAPHPQPASHGCTTSLRKVGPEQCSWLDAHDNTATSLRMSVCLLIVSPPTACVCLPARCALPLMLLLLLPPQGPTVRHPRSCSTRCCMAAAVSKVCGDE